MIKMPFITDTPNRDTNPIAAEMLKYNPETYSASTPPAMIAVSVPSMPAQSPILNEETVPSASPTAKK